MSEIGATDENAQTGELTVLLQAYAAGDQQALHALIDQVYAELRRIAAGQLRKEAQNLLLGQTALINFAALDLCQSLVV